MIDDILVIDGVVHAYNYVPENMVEGVSWEMHGGMLHALHKAFCPAAAPHSWYLPIERLCTPDIEMLGRSLFEESRVDACIYHSLPIYSFFKDGGAPLRLGRDLRARWPGRVFLYGGMTPFRPDALDEIDRLVEEDGVVGIKFYPLDLVEGRIVGFRMDDQALMYPLFERMIARGLKTVAMHKAMPFGPTHHEFFEVRDIGVAAADFPGLNFEIFHGGFGFLEETVRQLTYSPNVTVNLEGTGGLLVNAPGKFARILGEFLTIGAADRIVWGTGAPVQHPRLLLDAFWNFEMPQSLQEEMGFPAVTPEMKRAMLGGTQARICGLDLDRLRQDLQTGPGGLRTEVEPSIWGAPYVG